jgi:hypothetical protein
MKVINKEVSEFLNGLRESGVTNMFEAVPYIKKAFPEISKEEAKNYLIYWMENFGK